MTTMPRTMKDILRETAADHGLAPARLLTQDRRRKIAWARHDFMWRCRQVRRPNGEFRYTMVQIATFLGRDHSTCVHGVQQHAARLHQSVAA